MTLSLAVYQFLLEFQYARYLFEYYVLQYNLLSRVDKAKAFRVELHRLAGPLAILDELSIITFGACFPI